MGLGFFAIEPTPDSLIRLARMANCTALIMEANLTAMNFSVNYVANQARANAPVLTGNLRRSIQGIVHSPDLGEVGVGANVSYARRRELGFSGMTDSLGRFYSNDPGKFYLHNALEQSRPAIFAAFVTATESVLKTICI